MYYSVFIMSFIVMITLLSENKNIRFLSMMIFSFIIIVISGLRTFSDADYQNYLDMYLLVPSVFDLDMQHYQQLYGEFGYITLESIFRTFDANFYYLTLFCAFLSISIKTFVAYSFTKKLAIFVLCTYLCFHFITIEVIQIRWAIATSFILLSIHFFFSKKIILSIIFIFIATSFHYFALFFIMPYIVMLFRCDKMALLMIVLSIVFLSSKMLEGYLLTNTVFSNGFIYSKLEYYIKESGSSIGVFLYLKFFVLYLVSVFIFYKTKSKISFFNLILFLMLSMSSFLPLLFFRTSVVVDFITLINIVIYTNIYFKKRTQTLFLLIFMFFSSLWAMNDVLNYESIGSIKSYRSVIY